MTQRCLPPITPARAEIWRTSAQLAGLDRCPICGAKLIYDACPDCRGRGDYCPTCANRRTIKICGYEPHKGE